MVSDVLFLREDPLSFRHPRDIGKAPGSDPFSLMHALFRAAWTEGGYLELLGKFLENDEAVFSFSFLAPFCWTQVASGHRFFLTAPPKRIERICPR